MGLNEIAIILLIISLIVYRIIKKGLGSDK